MNDQKLQQAPIHSLYLSFLIPTMIATLSNSLYCLADVYFVSIGSGTMGLAAVNIVMPMYTLYSAIGLLFGVGASTVIAIERGGSNTRRAQQAFTMSALMMAAISIVMTALSLFALRPLACLLGADETLLPYVIEYLRPIVIGTPAFILMYASGILLRADDAPKLAMFSMLIGNLANIVLDYVFVIVLEGGLQGAAIATALAPLITLLIASSHFFSPHNRLRFCPIEKGGALLKRMLANGAGSGIMELAYGLVILLFNALILLLGDALFLAAYAIVTNIAYVLKGVFAAFGQAAQPIMSYHYGAKLYPRMQKTLHFALGITLACSLFLYLAFFLFCEPLAALFASGESIVIALGAQGITLYFLSLPFTAYNTVLMYFFQSAEWGSHATLLAFVKGVIFVLCALPPLYLLFGISGIWLAVPLAEAGACLLGYGMYRRLQNGGLYE